MAVILVVIAAFASLASQCGSTPPPVKAATEGAAVWQAVGSWSGHGNTQTESFPSDTGAFRVRWETSDERPPDTGTFRLVIHSAISGRPLLVAVDSRGVARDTAYVNEDPRVFYVVVESANLQWSFTVEEGVVGPVSGLQDHRRTDKPAVSLAAWGPGVGVQ